MKYFSYDPEGFGFRFHDTAEEAKNAAIASFKDEEDLAGTDGWNDSVEDICWGKVTEKVQLAYEGPAENSEGKEYDFELKEI